MRGTIVNVVAVLVGSGIGLAVGDRLPERLQRIITTGLGLSVLLIGGQMALKVENMLVVIASMVLGGVIGELLGIEAGLERAGEWLKTRTRSGSGTFVTGYVPLASAAVVMALAAYALFLRQPVIGVLASWDAFSLQTFRDAGAHVQDEVSDVGGRKLIASVKDADGNITGLVQMPDRRGGRGS